MFCVLRKRFGCSNFNLTRHVLPMKLSSRAVACSGSWKQKDTTVDLNELKTFSGRVDEWWDLKGPCRGLHALNELRVPFVMNGMKQNKSDSEYPRNLKVLDVGCGGGILSEGLAELGAEVTGIDASSQLIDIAIHHSGSELLKNKPTYYCSTIEDHAIEHPNVYDGIVASEVIEHVNNQELFVKSCVEALKPNGRIFFTAPSKTRIAQLYLIWFAENFVSCPPRGTHQYEKFISVKELSHLLQKNNCQIEISIGCFHNVIINKWFWTKNQQIFYVIQAIKC